MTRFIGESRNLYKWPPLHVAYIAVMYHYIIALSLASDAANIKNLLVLGGLDVPIGVVGVTATIALLIAVSSSALIGLLFEWRWNSWLYPTLLTLPQYFLVLAGAGHSAYIIYTQEFMNKHYSFWLMLSVLSLFECVALFHTIAIVTRISFWKLVLYLR